MGCRCCKCALPEQADLMALADKTPFKKTQLRQWYKEFMASCPKGTMDKEQFAAHFKDVTPLNPGALNLARLTDYIFDRFDTNHDGVITFVEFVQAIAIPISGSIDEKLNWAFSMYDSDGDGFVTKDEMTKIVNAVHEKNPNGERDQTQQKVDKIFANMDANKDGKLSRDEFINGFKSDQVILKSLIDKETTAKDTESVAIEVE